MAKKKFIPLDITLKFEHPDDLDVVFKDEELLGKIYDGVTMAIENIGIKKSPKITIITLSNMDLAINLQKKNYKKVLDKAIEFYTKKEDYNKCIELTKLKGKL